MAGGDDPEGEPEATEPSSHDGAAPEPSVPPPPFDDDAERAAAYGSADDDDEPGVEPEDERPGRRRRRLERLLPDIFKRAIERGIETGLGTLANAGGHAKSVAQKTNEAAQGLPKELSSVPKEVAGFVFSQIDDTKNAMVRVVAREVREFLEAADIAKELHRALTSLSFEIKTEIRFIPNDAGGVKPDVRAAVSPKRQRRTNRRPSANDEPPADPESDDEAY